MIRFRRFLPYLFWGALLIGFVVALLPKPVPLPGNPGDKVQHILAFLSFAAIGSVTYPRVAAWRLWIGLSAYGALIEFAQMIPVLNRSPELLDWIADTVAAGVVILLFALFGAISGRSRRGLGG